MHSVAASVDWQLPRCTLPVCFSDCQLLPPFAPVLPALASMCLSMLPMLHMLMLVMMPNCSLINAQRVKRFCVCSACNAQWAFIRAKLPPPLPTPTPIGSCHYSPPPPVPPHRSTFDCWPVKGEITWIAAQMKMYFKYAHANCQLRAN